MRGGEEDERMREDRRRRGDERSRRGEEVQFQRSYLRSCILASHALSGDNN